MKFMKTLGSLLTLVTLPMLLALSGCATTAPVPKHHSLRMYVLDCGSIDITDIAVSPPGADAGQPKHLADTCYLIVHPRGIMLWDTGLSDSLVTQPNGVSTKSGSVLHVDKTLRSQLEEIGYPPKSVRLLAISHMQGDHVGNANLFPGATLLIQKPEFDVAFGKQPQKYGFDPASYASLRNSPVRVLQGDYDVFGDGSVVIKLTPGHIFGHQSLFLHLGKTGNIVISDDLAHDTANGENHDVASSNDNQAATPPSTDATAQFLKTNDAELWIQHDADQNATIRHAPYFYE